MEDHDNGASAIGHCAGNVAKLGYHRTRGVDDAYPSNASEPARSPFPQLSIRFLFLAIKRSFKGMHGKHSDSWTSTASNWTLGSLYMLLELAVPPSIVASLGSRKLFVFSYNSTCKEGCHHVLTVHLTSIGCVRSETARNAEWAGAWRHGLVGSNKFSTFLDNDHGLR